MSTRSLVPRASGEGAIGTSTIRWGDGQFNKVNAYTGNYTHSLTISGVSVATGAGGKWTDGAAAGDIYHNAGGVGIGTTNPTGKLHVSGGSAAFDSGVYISGDLKVSGDAYFSPDTIYLGSVPVSAEGEYLVANVSGASGDFSEQLTISGISVSTGNFAGGSEWGDAGYVPVEIGSAISTSTLNDRIGSSLASNSDGTIIAAGSHHVDKVWIYEYAGGTWSQKGGTLAGAGSFGISVSLNSAGSIVAIGSSSLNGNVGQVEVFEWNAGTASWDAKGSSIAGAGGGAGTPNQFGRSLSLNGAGTLLIIGAPGNDTGGNDSGQVKVFEWNGGTSSWDLKGSAIDGAAGTELGYGVSINDAGTIIAMGSSLANAGLGEVIIRQWDVGTTDWIAKGSPIVGPSPGNQSFGYALALNSNGEVVIIGAKGNDDIAANAGMAKVFKWDAGTTSWIAKGAPMYGTAVGDLFGDQVAINSAGDVAGVGAYQSSTSATRAGKAEVFKYNGSSWVKTSSVYGVSVDDEMGTAVCLNAAGNVFGAGAPKVDHGGSADAGEVKVFSIPTASSIFSDKNVGIGVSSPQARLHVGGGDAIFGNNVHISGTTYISGDLYVTGDSHFSPDTIYIAGQPIKSGAGSTISLSSSTGLMFSGSTGVKMDADGVILFSSSGLKVGDAAVMPDPGQPDTIYFAKTPQVRDAEGNPTTFLTADRLGLGTAAIMETDPGDIKFKL